MRPILLQVLTADEEHRAAEIGNLYAFGIAPATIELLVDAEQDPALRGVLVGMLRETERS